MTEIEPLVDEYVTWLTVEKGRSTATTGAYRRDIRAFAEWTDARGIDIEAVGESDVERYFNELRGHERAESSLARAMSSLRGWFGFMVEEGLITGDPTARLRGSHRGRSLPKPLAEEEVERMLDAIPSGRPSDLRDRALLELLYGTGARVSEAVGIELGDLDFDEELILVTGKGSKQRLVPMGSVLRNALEAYLGPRGRPSFPGAKRHVRLFVNAQGGPLSRQGVDLIVRKRALLVGVARSRVSAHVFRHSCATHMLAHGADIRVVQELLGHASIATTQIYTAVSITSLQREYRNAHPRAIE